MQVISHREISRQYYPKCNIFDLLPRKIIKIKSGAAKFAGDGNHLQSRSAKSGESCNRKKDGSNRAEPFVIVTGAALK